MLTQYFYHRFIINDLFNNHVFTSIWIENALLIIIRHTNNREGLTDFGIFKYFSICFLTNDDSLIGICFNRYSSTICRINAFNLILWCDDDFFYTVLSRANDAGSFYNDRLHATLFSDSDFSL